MVSIETPSVALAGKREGSSFRVGPVEDPVRLRSVDDMTLLGDDGRPVPVKLSILMSAYNEERTIMKVVHSIMQASFPCEVELNDSEGLRVASATVHWHVRLNRPAAAEVAE